MTCDAHIRCNEKITRESIDRDCINDPILGKLWNEASIDIVFGHESSDEYYDKIRDMLPKYRSEMHLHNTRLIVTPMSVIGDHDRVYHTLKWFAEYLRQLVKRTGEVWYTEIWISGDYLEKEDLNIVTYDVNKEICFMEYEDKEFRFETDTFYRFVDGNAQK